MLGREERRPLTVVVQGSLSCGDWYLGWCLYELRLMRGTVSPGWYPAGVRLITSPTAPRELGSCGHTQRTPRGASSCPKPGLRSAGAGLRHHPRSTFPPGPVLPVACLHARTRTCRSGQFGRRSGSVPDLLPRRTPSQVRQAPLQAVQIRPSLRSQRWSPGPGPGALAERNSPPPSRLGNFAPGVRLAGCGLSLRPG